MMRTLDEVRKALKDHDPTTRKVALDRLVELSAPDAFESIVPFLTDPSPMVRSGAIFNLGELKDSRGLPYLLEIARDADEEVVRSEAFRALGEFRHPEIPSLLIDEIHHPKRSRMARQESARQLRYYESANGVQALSRVLREDEDAWARELAAESLYVFNQASLIPVWRTALEDDNPDVALHALRALKELGVNPNTTSNTSDREE